MDTKALSIETGLVTYDLNGKVTLTFNPTDSAFIERLFNTFDELDKKQEKHKAAVAEAMNGNKRDVFNIARQSDAEMREMIDSALGVPVCDALFGDMSMYALANGLPVWANLLLAIIDELDMSFAAEQKKTSARIRKYSEKYKK